MKGDVKAKSTMMNREDRVKARGPYFLFVFFIPLQM